MPSLKDKTLLITGGSRGIGLAIALRAAADGANIAVAAKTDKPHPKLSGTIHTTAEAITEAGGNALPLVVDVRNGKQVNNAVAQTVEAFGGIDIVINNAGAIALTGTLETPLKRFDLMQQVNTRATFAVAQAALPHLLKAENPHILALSPPLNLDPKWLGLHVAYTLSKYGMSLIVLGLAEEFKHQGIAVNALWPRTLIATAAVRNLPGGEDMVRHARKPQIVADAAHAVLTRDSRACTGNLLVDEDVLREEGVTDFARYAADPNVELAPDLFLES